MNSITAEPPVTARRLPGDLAIWFFILAEMLAFAVFFWLPDRPSDATWLTAQERDWITRSIARENADLLSRQKAGKAFLSMEDGAGILPPARANGMSHIAALSNDGRLLIFPIDQMKRLSGGKGVQIIGLKGKESLKAILAAKGPLINIRGTFRNKAKILLSDEKHLGQRARRGAAGGLINQPMIENLPEHSDGATS